MSYVESTGGICVCFDDSETLCVVNDDCDLVDTTAISKLQLDGAADALSTLKLDAATDALCQSYSIVVDKCTEVSVKEIAENGCMSYVESTGGICVCFDDSETLCVVNDDCDLVDTTAISKLQLDGATDALCESYSIVVEACTDVSVEEISENGCMSYVESTGGICVCYDDSKTLCVVNDDCDAASVIPTLRLDGATDALCESYSIVVDACTDVSVQEIAENGCMSYIESTGGICVCQDDSETLCVVNDDCDLVDTSIISTLQLDGATDALCQSYSIVVDDCTNVSEEDIAENGCMSYVESTGGICVCYDDSKTLCVVNDDCDLVNVAGLSTLKLDDATDALCESYSIVVSACTDVSVDDIAENGCMSYVEATGGICVCYDDSKQRCIVNDDCEFADTSALPAV